MNKKTKILILIILFILIGSGIYFYINNSNFINGNNSEYEADKASTETNNSEASNNSDKENTNNTEIAANESAESNQTDVNNTADSANTNSGTFENQLSAFSTKIYSDDANRTKNMEITTSTLNETIVKNGETFSFCDTVGPATSSKGYLEADIYDNNGNKKKGYGGGNCQVSSTLYNAVLAVSNLSVVERHPHSNHVPYVPEGKDAAVAHGSYDFKFQNNTGNDIKILASITEGLVNVSIMSN